MMITEKTTKMEDGTHFPLGLECTLVRCAHVATQDFAVDCVVFLFCWPCERALVLRIKEPEVLIYNFKIFQEKQDETLGFG